jgi:molybdopterin-guanine dinucleotide biosynthesis protein A
MMIQQLPGLAKQVRAWGLIRHMRANSRIDLGTSDCDEPPLDYVDVCGAPATGQHRLVALNSHAGHTAPRLSVVVPTRNEEGNVGPLLESLARVFSPGEAEVIVIDDSSDATLQALASSAAGCPLLVSQLHRPAGMRKGGPSTAVIAGARAARGDWVLVMDADLQHPPEAAALLARAAMRHDADIVVGTRYVGRGSSAGDLDGPSRVLMPSWATRLAKSLFPRRLVMVSDPLSGLFAFQRASVDLDRLNPVGFKILLEILVRNPVAKVADVRRLLRGRASPSCGTWPGCAGPGWSGSCGMARRRGPKESPRPGDSWPSGWWG